MEIKELIGQEELEARIAELAKQIDKDYEGKEIVAICILNGAAFFAVDLTLKMKTRMQVEFIKISSYEGTQSTGTIKKHLDIEKEKIEGKDVLIIEDIIDTGKSMNYITKHLQEKAPRTLKICSLLSKPSRREEEVNIDYFGFEVPNKFIVGYGFDDEDGFNRNLPYIGYKD